MMMMITRTQNVSEYMLVLALCLVDISVHAENMLCSGSGSSPWQLN